MLYVLCYPVLQALDSQKIEAFRQVHEPARARLVRAHITLVFGMDTGAAQVLQERMSAIAGEAQSFAISLERPEIRLDPVTGGWKLLVVIGEGRHGLTTLHRHLYADLEPSGLRPRMRFEPHVTVATSPLRDRVQVAREASDQLGLPVRGRVEALDLVALDESGLHSLRQVQLGSENSSEASPQSPVHPGNFS
jgi:2'-5' RNA ligase